jgi:hypothetical protein
MIEVSSRSERKHKKVHQSGFKSESVDHTATTVFMQLRLFEVFVFDPLRLSFLITNHQSRHCSTLEAHTGQNYISFCLVCGSLFIPGGDLDQSSSYSS